MDHDDVIVGKILTRREALAAAGKAGLSVLLAPAAAKAIAQQEGRGERRINLVATPQATEGPFFVDENLNRSNLLGDTTRPAVINGLPLTLQTAVYRLTSAGYTPIENAQVDVWHADTIGVYSDEPRGANPEDTRGQTWLRGFQRTSRKGVVQFQTIYPGWYPGRTAHIHFKIRVRNAAGTVTYTFTSQWFFDDTLTDQVYSNPPYSSRPNRTTRNLNDNIYAQRQADGTMVGSHLMLWVGRNPTGTGFVGTFSVALRY